LLVKRDGYDEETYFTFSLSPIFEDDVVTGILGSVQETTQKILSVRRLKTLSIMGTNSSGKYEYIYVCINDILLMMKIIINNDNLTI
jgi:hypothetical protein